MMYDTRQPAELGSQLGAARADRPLSPSFVPLVPRNEPRPRAPSPLNPNHRRSSSIDAVLPAQHPGSAGSPGTGPGDSAQDISGGGGVPSGSLRPALQPCASLPGLGQQSPRPPAQEGLASKANSQQHGGPAGPAPGLVAAGRKLSPLRPKGADWGPGSPAVLAPNHASRFADEVPASPGRSASRRKSLDSGSWNVAAAAGIFPDIVPSLREMAPAAPKPRGQDSAGSSSGAGQVPESASRMGGEGLLARGQSNKPRLESMGSGAWRLPAVANIFSDLIPASPRRAKPSLFLPKEESAQESALAPPQPNGSVEAASGQSAGDTAVLSNEASGGNSSAWRPKSMDIGTRGISAAAQRFAELMPSSPRRAPSPVRPTPDSAALHGPGAFGGDLSPQLADQVPSSPRKSLLKLKADAIFSGFGPGSPRRTTGVPSEMIEGVAPAPRRSNSLAKMNSGAWDLAAASGLLEDMVPHASSKRAPSLLNRKAATAPEAGSASPEGSTGSPAADTPAPPVSVAVRLNSKQGEMGDGQPGSPSLHGMGSPGSAGRAPSPLRPRQDNGASGASVQDLAGASAARSVLPPRDHAGEVLSRPGPDGGSSMLGAGSAGASLEISSVQRPPAQKPAGATPLGPRVRGPSPLRPRLIIGEPTLDRVNSQGSARSQGSSPRPERGPMSALEGRTGTPLSPMHRLVLEGSFSMPGGQASPPLPSSPGAVTGERASSLPGAARGAEHQYSGQGTLSGRLQGAGRRAGAGDPPSDERFGGGGQGSLASPGAVPAGKQQRRLQVMERQDTGASVRSAHSGRDIEDTFLARLEPLELQPTFLRGLTNGSARARREAWEGAGGRDTDSVCSEDVVLMSLEQAGEDEEGEQYSRSREQDAGMAAALPHVKTVVRKQLGSAMLHSLGRTISSFGSGKFSVKEITNEEDELNADMGLPLVGSPTPAPGRAVEYPAPKGHTIEQHQPRAMPRHPQSRLQAEGSRLRNLQLQPQGLPPHQQRDPGQGAPGPGGWAQAGPAAGSYLHATLEDDGGLFGKQDTSKSTVSVQCRMDADGSGYFAELDDDSDRGGRAPAGAKEVDPEDWGRTVTEIFVSKRGQPGALSRRHGREQAAAVDSSRSRSEVEIDRDSTSSMDSARLPSSAAGSARLARGGPDSARLEGSNNPFMVPGDTLLEYDLSARSRRKQHTRRREQPAEPTGQAAEEEGAGTLERPGRVHRLGRGR